MSEPLIRRGEQVIVDGKLICEVKRDIHRLDTCEPSDFQWFITPPDRYAPFDETPGFRTAPDGSGRPDVFLSGEWLTERQQRD